MRELGYFRVRVSLDGERWRTNRTERWSYREPAEEVVKEYTFSEFMEEKPLTGVWEDYDLFRRKKVLYLYDIDLKWYEDSKTRVYVKREWVTCDDVTMNNLFKELQVDEFIEFMKDKGMNVWVR